MQVREYILEGGPTMVSSRSKLAGQSTNIDDILRAYAQALIQQRRYDEAERVLIDSIDYLAGTGWSETPFHLAEIFLHRNEGTARAIELLDEAREVAARRIVRAHMFAFHHSRILASLSWAHAAAGDQAKSEELEQQTLKAICLKKKPEHAAVMLRLSWACQCRGDLAKARDYAARTAQADPSGYSGQMARELLRALPRISTKSTLLEARAS